MIIRYFTSSPLPLFSYFCGMQVFSTSAFFARHISWLMVLSMVVSLTACGDDEVCEEVTANNLRIGFYPAGQEDEEFWATIDSIRVHTTENPDSPVHDTLYNVSSLELPLNIHADSCSFILDFFEERDTIWLTYQRETHLISVECGFTVFFDLQQVEHTTHYIEGLFLEVPEVTNTLDEHIQIFVPDTIPGN